MIGRWRTRNACPALGRRLAARSIGLDARIRRFATEQTSPACYRVLAGHISQLDGYHKTLAAQAVHGGLLHSFYWLNIRLAFSLLYETRGGRIDLTPVHTRLHGVTILAKYVIIPILP